MTESLHLLRDPHLFDGDHCCGNRAENGAGSLAVAQRVAAEACQTGDFVGEVAVVDLLELDPIVLEHDSLDHRFDLARGKRCLVRNRRDFAAGAQHRRRARAKVQVRRLIGDERAEEGFHSVQRATAHGCRRR